MQYCIQIKMKVFGIYKSIAYIGLFGYVAGSGEGLKFINTFIGRGTFFLSCKVIFHHSSTPPPINNDDSVILKKCSVCKLYTQRCLSL